MEAYQPLQELEAAMLVYNVMNDPDDWDGHLKRRVNACPLVGFVGLTDNIVSRSAASSVKMVVYGTPPIVSKDDPLIRHNTGINGG